MVSWDILRRHPTKLIITETERDGCSNSGGATGNRLHWIYQTDAPTTSAIFFFHFNLENVIFSRLRKGQYGGYHCTALVFVLLSFNFLLTLR